MKLKLMETLNISESRLNFADAPGDCLCFRCTTAWRPQMEPVWRLETTSACILAWICLNNHISVTPVTPVTCIYTVFTCIYYVLVTVPSRYPYSHVFAVFVWEIWWTQGTSTIAWDLQDLARTCSSEDDSPALIPMIPIPKSIASCKPIRGHGVLNSNGWQIGTRDNKRTHTHILTHLNRIIVAIGSLESILRAKQQLKKCRRKKIRHWFWRAPDSIFKCSWNQ